MALAVVSCPVTKKKGVGEARVQIIDNCHFMRLAYLDPNEMSGRSYFVHAPRLFYCPKRRIGYARCSLTGNKNYPAITKLTNTM